MRNPNHPPPELPTVKMPQNAKRISKTQVRKTKKLEQTRSAALDDAEATFARTIKALGNRRFRIVVPDEKKHLIEVDAHIPGKKVALVQVNDIVVVAQSGLVYEIYGSMDPRSVSKLRKEKRIHPALLMSGEWNTLKAKSLELTAIDEDFEFDYDDVPSEAESDDDDAPSKKAADDIDIDDI